MTDEYGGTFNVFYCQVDEAALKIRKTLELYKSSHKNVYIKHWQVSATTTGTHTVIVALEIAWDDRMFAGIVNEAQP